MVKPVKDMIGERPEKEVFNPPVDKPFDESGGGAPPYPFPPELIKELAGKSEDEVSSLLSKFRTGLSEHRTRLSEHRTDLSEHRTDLSDYRTELSAKRTEMSEHRTALSDERSHLSNERTHLSYLRTSISLITLGVTINRFAIFLIQGNRLASDDQALLPRMRHTEQLGLGMVVAGILLLCWSLYRYRTVHAQILSESFAPPVTSLTVMTLSVIFLGAITTLILMLG